ncbi:MAG: hypothetical protein LBV28_03490 [Puniceicoccales bacterium]|jgi:hypothetical protein|nr:hypothetical protein [Puniceicoccales bacterium]
MQVKNQKNEARLFALFRFGEELLHAAFGAKLVGTGTAAFNDFVVLFSHKWDADSPEDVWRASFF